MLQKPSPGHQLLPGLAGRAKWAVDTSTTTSLGAPSLGPGGMTAGVGDVELEESHGVVHTTRLEQSVPKQVRLFLRGRRRGRLMDRRTAGRRGVTCPGARDRPAGQDRETQPKRHDSRVMRRHDVSCGHGREGRSEGATAGGGAVGSVSEDRQDDRIGTAPEVP